MSRLDDALRDGGLTWKAGDEDSWELHGDDEVLGRIRGDVVTLDERRVEIRHGRGYTTLVDAGRGSRLGTLRVLGHGAGQVTLPSSRVRISKQGVGPFRWEVTEDLSGPRLLNLLKLAGRLRIRPGDALVEGVPVGMLATFAALTIIGDLRARTVSAVDAQATLPKVGNAAAG